MRDSPSNSLSAILSTWAGVLPAPKITSGKPLRNARCVSTWAKPRSANGAVWNARTTASRLTPPARNFSSSLTASVVVTRETCHSPATGSREKGGGWKAPNSKHQAPEKLQIPKIKLQINPKHQIPNGTLTTRLGVFGIGILLGFGAWDLGFLRCL